MKKLLLSFIVCALSFCSYAQSSMPSIMVVPYKSGTKTYLDVLKSDGDRRMAVEKVNEVLRQNGIVPIDLQAMTNVTLKAAEFESEVTEDSRDKQLLDQSGADIYIVVDVDRTSAANGVSASVSLKAYNRSTGAIMVSKVGFSPAFRTTAYDKLYVYAIKQALNGGFLNDIKAAFAKSQSEGSSVSMRITLGTNSSVMNLIQHQTPKGRLGDNVRNWLRANSVNGDFHIKGSTAESIVYDRITIPPMTPDGYKMLPEDFASAFVNFLYQDLGITAEERIDGSSIYISIF